MTDFSVCLSIFRFPEPFLRPERRAEAKGFFHFLTDFEQRTALSRAARVLIRTDIKSARNVARECHATRDQDHRSTYLYAPQQGQHATVNDVCA